jgi:hypothetical protein
MKSLYEPAAAEEIKARLNTMGATSERQWGKMSPAQALAHCANAMESATGDSKPPRQMIGRVLGPIAKAMVINKERPFGKNSPTAPNLIISDQRQLDVERQRLIDIIDKFVNGGPAACTDHPHQFFGKLTPDEWGRLMYKHLDHHLRQFGA